jgi:hypothetical protein
MHKKKRSREMLSPPVPAEGEKPRRGRPPKSSNPEVFFFFFFFFKFSFARIKDQERSKLGGDKSGAWCDRFVEFDGWGSGVGAISSYPCPSSGVCCVRRSSCCF